MTCLIAFLVMQWNMSICHLQTLPIKNKVLPALPAKCGTQRQQSTTVNPPPGNTLNNDFWIRCIPIGLLLIQCLAGLWLCNSGSRSFYLGCLLSWTAPPLMLQWFFAGPYIVSRIKECAIIVGASTMYLCWVDHTAIGLGVWEISPESTVGVYFGGHLPLEEVLFFFIVNCMIVGGVMAIDRTLAIARLLENRVGGRNGIMKPIDDRIKQLAASTSTTQSKQWTMYDEFQLLVKSTTIREPHLDQDIVADHVILWSLLRHASKTFSMASLLYPQPLREDVLALYGFCRVSDDLADMPRKEHFALAEQSSRTAALNALRQFVDECYDGTLDLKDGGMPKYMDAVEDVLAPSWEDEEDKSDPYEIEMVEFCRAAMRVFARRVPRCVPKKNIIELLDGYTWDLEGRSVDSSEDLLRYCELVAGSVGEACAYMMEFHNRNGMIELGCHHPRGSKGSEGNAKSNATDEVSWISTSMTRKARDMGVALQLVNIARDMVTDAEELGRLYIPSTWLSCDKTTTYERKDSGLEDTTTTKPTTKGHPDANAKTHTDGAIQLLKKLLISDPWSQRENLKRYADRLLEMAHMKAVSAKLGIEMLPISYKKAVLAALKMYLEIGEVISEAEEYPRRAVVPFKRKLGIMAECFYMD
ncbi:hypothetical protein HDU76_005234 [Blyttiomyces sp. JEL0837]|nr:hypothetical protein HDU76_005234 [Blyttiomyces sp. JEL0837]